MSYTSGIKTIEKSMNGLVEISTGGGVIIDGDTITTVNLDAENIECNTLVVDNLSTFNGALPTSTQTTNPINQSEYRKRRVSATKSSQCFFTSKLV